MARGKQTDPTRAVLAKVMAEMGFESGLIAEVTGLASSTVSDIARGHGVWGEFPRTEVFEITRRRVQAVLENAAFNLATEAMARLEVKIKTASFMELVSIVDVSARIVAGGYFGEQR